MGMTGEPDECGDAAAWYRRRLDWPCTASGHAVWLLAGQVLDAVDVPELLGPAMVELLRRAEQPLAVVEVPGELECWRFLVRPGTDRPHLLATELNKHGAAHRAHAEVIELPPTRVRGGALRWLLGPHPAVPSLSQVAAALAAVVVAEESGQSQLEHRKPDHSRR